LIVTSIRVVLIITGKPLISFVFTYTIDFLLNSLFLLLFYKKEKEGKLFDWRVEISVIKGLLKDSWPLILSGFATMIYMKIDQIMIGKILGDTELGIYASAVKLSEAWYFIPTVVTSSVFPAILNAKRKDINLYNKRLQTLYDFFMWFTIIFSIIISCLSSQIINLFYGKEYINAGPVLAIHIWAGFAVFLGIASGKYLIAENMTKFSFIRTVVGAVVNVVSNIILLPRIGIIGAAVSTLFSYTASTFSVLFIPETRDLGKNLLKSFNIFRIIKDLWK
jgi:O-antigen/teichoic acid export membrane protein